MAGRLAYLADMVMIPPKPRTIWRDLISFFGRGERHNLLAIIPAIAIPAGMIWVFTNEVDVNLMPTEPPITYVNVWEEGRTDDQIIERQRVLALRDNERRALRRDAMRAIADASGVDYDREAAAEADRITEENRRTLSRESTEAETDSP